MADAPMADESASDRDLFAVWCDAIRRSDRRAFEALFRATHEPLLRYARGFTFDEVVAHDLVQETFLRLWERRATLDPERSLKALLYRTVRNLALNHTRDRKSRDQKLADYGDDLHTATFYAPPNPDAQTDANQMARRLQGWIDELPDRQREALLLSRFDGLSHEEIADAMDVSPRTVNNHLVKALKHLRDRILAFEPSLLHR